MLAYKLLISSNNNLSAKSAIGGLTSTRGTHFTTEFLIATKLLPMRGFLEIKSDSRR